MAAIKKETQNQGKRLHILSQREYEEIYRLPKFTKEERIDYFELNYFELEKFKQTKSNEAKILFVLQLGYFKAKFQFYVFRLKDVIEDIKYISEKYLDSLEITNYNLLSYEKSGKNQRKVIRELLDFKDYSNQDFQNFLLELCKIDINPKFLYENLHIEFIKRKIIIPGYKTFQLLVGKAIQTYEKQLHNNLSSLITKEDEKKIENFMKLRDNDDYLSKLAFVRTSSKGFSQKYVLEEIDKRKHLEKIFSRAKEIIKKLDLSEEVIKKYARYIDAYQYSHIRKWEPNRRNLHIICFVYYRYLKSNDDMIRTFIYWVNKYENDVRFKLREEVFKNNMENSKMFPGIAKLLKFIYNEDIWKTLTKEQIWAEISKLLNEEQAEKLEKFFEKNYVKHGNLRWKLFDLIQGKIQSNIRNILKNIRFNYSDSLKNKEPDFVKFLDYYQGELFRTKDIPKLSPKIDYSNFPYRKYEMERKYIQGDNKRLEIYLFIRIRDLLESGELYIEDSLEFRHIELDLISKEEFKKNKNKILSEINLPYIQEPLSKILKEKIEYLDEMYHKVNKNILEGKNEYFNDKGKDDWSLRYDAKEDEEFENLFEDYEAELIDILKFVNENTDYLKAFEHIAPTNTKKDDEENKLLAVLLGYGTDLGLYRMSKNLVGVYSNAQLRTTSMTRFREETLLKANEMIINKTAQLPIFEHYNVNDIGSIHSSSDGQKFSVSVNTITARYSQKYFGKGKGLSVITLSANFQPLAAKTISPNEFEGHYVLELLLMNESEIQPEKHSTDNHGINEVNFGMLDFFGFKFCPRYKTLTKKTQNLVASKRMPSEYKIKPNNKKGIVNVKNILDAEEDIKRVISSIALKKTSAGTIIKKITNLPEKNPLRMAFSEFNRIVSSTYILQYIDDEKTRVQVQIALNRGEAFHKLKKAVFYADNGRIKGKSEHEQIVYQNSCMVICSAIIYYNSRVLSKLMNQKKLPQKEFEKIVKSTPFVWNHIDIYGKYDFNKKKKDLKTIEKKLK